MKYEKLKSWLEQLTVNEIEQFRSCHPENRTLTVLCNAVIKEKTKIRKFEDLENGSLI